MNASIKEDSMLSNISNITVKIDHNRSDGSGFFNHFIKQSQNDKEIPLDFIQDQDSFNHTSLLNQINFRIKIETNNHQPENTWVSAKKDVGLSEQQNSEQQMEQENRSYNQQISPQYKSYPRDQPIKLIHIDNKLSQQKRLQLLLQKRLKNQTKNIPKNYGKAIISFIQKYQDKVKKITSQNKVDYNDFIQQIKEKKKTINTIADLRNMWIDYKYAKCMRLLSNLFLRKYALNYIFNSRICNFGSHIKYRYRLCEAIKEPFSFKHIKDY